MLSAAIVFALLAAGLAWLVKTTTQTPRYQPGVQTTERIHDSLDQLTDNPAVMTDREKVLQLQQTFDADDSVESKSDPASSSDSSRAGDLDD